MYAYRGIHQFLKTEHNACLHALASLLVIALGLILRVDKTEWMLLLLAMGLVWVAEIMNTAIEKLVDGVATVRNAQWAYVKDAAAGGVLIAALTAFIIGAAVFLPRIWPYIASVFKDSFQ